MAKTIQTKWLVRTYDVWGNKNYGWDVNNVNRSFETNLRLKVQIANPGKPQEFKYASPTNYQLKKLFGVGCRIETDGDDLSIYVNRTRDSYPIGELRCISHQSLSPIKE